MRFGRSLVGHGLLVLGVTVFGLKSLDSCIFKEPIESSCAVFALLFHTGSEPTLPSFRTALGCPFFFLLKSF